MSSFRIGHVTYRPPWPAMSGGEMRALALIRQLALRHDLNLFCIECSPEQRAELATLGVRVHAMNPQRRKGHHAERLRSFVSGVPLYYTPYDSVRLSQCLAESSASFDVVITDQLRSVATVLRARLPTSVFTVIDTQNVETKRVSQMADLVSGSAQRLLAQIHAAGVRRFEPSALKRFDLTVAVSSTDAEAFSQLGVDRGGIVVVPNGVDLDHYVALQPESDTPSVLFIGTLNYLPNEDAISWLAHDIMPVVRHQIPKAELTVVGSRPSSRVVSICGADDWISLHPDVADVRPYLAAAQVVVVPLRAGGGTRLKILEALAARRPVIATSVGAEGLDLRPNRHYVRADRTSELIEATVGLLSDDEKRRKIAQIGFERVAERYSWSRTLAPLEQAIEDKIGRGKMRGRYDAITS